MDCNKHGAWSATTISAVEAQRKCKESFKTLGCPQLLVSLIIGTIHALKYPRQNTQRSPTYLKYKFEQCVKMVSHLGIPIIHGVLLGVTLQLCPELLAGESTRSPNPSSSPTCTH